MIYPISTVTVSPRSPSPSHHVNRPSLQTLRDTVHTVLVDEAAQAVEAETLIPLCLATRRCDADGTDR